jgi:hypothetical protein
MDFIASGSPQAVNLFPALQKPDQSAEELLVIDDQGGVYSNDDAWLMCLWALEDYREWAARLSASPTLKGMARQMYSMISRQRHSLSAALGMLSESELERRLRNEPFDTCAVPPLPPASTQRPFIAPPSSFTGTPSSGVASSARVRAGANAGKLIAGPVLCNGELVRTIAAEDGITPVAQVWRQKFGWVAGGRPEWIPLGTTPTEQDFERYGLSPDGITPLARYFSDRV